MCGGLAIAKSLHADDNDGGFGEQALLPKRFLYFDVLRKLGIELVTGNLSGL